MFHLAVHPYVSLFLDEIDRFQQFASLRSEIDRRTMRRRDRRYHRSWPLLVATYHNKCLREYSAALYDASKSGIGFMTDQNFTVESLVYIRLFWHELTALRIPAVIRHVTHQPEGIIVGCEYLLSSENCETSLLMDQDLCNPQ